jgi:hypothetical protein
VETREIDYVEQFTASITQVSTDMIEIHFDWERIRIVVPFVWARAGGQEGFDSESSTRQRLDSS